MEGETEGSPEARCQATFLGAEDDPGLADKIERQNPGLVCEAVRVSAFSPGPVENDEGLHRVIVSPRDIDDQGFVAAAPFEKVARNGLSVIRSIASPEEIEALVTDGMFSKVGESLRSALAVLTAKASQQDGVRSLTDDHGERLFGVYDQTVNRRDESLPQVPTHAGIFLRRPPAGTSSRRRLQKDFAGILRDMFLDRQLAIGDIGEGVLVKINERAKAGEFVLPADVADPA